MPQNLRSPSMTSLGQRRSGCRPVICSTASATAMPAIKREHQAHRRATGPAAEPPSSRCRPTAPTPRSGRPRPRPAVCSSATKTAPSGSPSLRRLHGGDVGRANAEVMMNARAEDGPLQQRAENVRKQKIGNGFQLISGRGMSGDLETQLAQMLHRAPHFGAAGAQLLGDARAADDHGRVVAQQAHDAAQARVGGAVGRSIGAGWRGAGDRTIMRERGEIWIAAVRTERL